jgi:hypothetical protein
VPDALQKYKRLESLRRRKEAYRRLFLDEHGQLKPESRRVLDDLYAFSRFFQDASLEPQVLAALEGRRQTVRHLVKCLKVTDSELSRLLEREPTNE